MRWGLKSVKYRFDIGANVRAQSPAPQSQSQGKITEREFDSIGRLLKDKVVNNGGAYTRYEYPTNGIQSKVFSTIIDTNSNSIGDTADEVLSESWADGAGRVRRSRTEHPGSTGGWSGSIVEYDILGRAKRQSVPTEIAVPDVNNPDTWAPAGDDATRGWLWSYQKYDWMNRVVRKINTDGIDQTTLNDSDQLITYEGCGCAGGLVTTIKGESTTAVDVSETLQNNKRRTQKIYRDILGRTFKTEAWDLDGAGSAPYSTVKTTFNGRDQAMLIRQYSGAETSSTYQDTTATFDGHGRMKTQHRPEQDANTFSTYNYSTDDSVSSVVDARGAIAEYIYNSRGLVTNLDYSVPQNSTISVASDITMTYDALGNPVSMADGLGTISYEYDELSKMTAETRVFSDTLADKPTTNYKIAYEYALAGQLKSYTDPFGDKINLAHDKTGRIGSVTGDSFGGVTTYANNPGYRAWGNLKHLEYGNGLKLDATFNSRLQTATLQVKHPTDTSKVVFDKEYEYYQDGRLKLADEQLDPTYSKYDRSYIYDHIGRVKEAKNPASRRRAKLKQICFFFHTGNRISTTLSGITPRENPPCGRSRTGTSMAAMLTIVARTLPTTPKETLPATRTSITNTTPRAG